MVFASMKDEEIHDPTRDDESNIMMVDRVCCADNNNKKKKEMFEQLDDDDDDERNDDDEKSATNNNKSYYQMSASTTPPLTPTPSSSSPSSSGSSSSSWSYSSSSEERDGCRELFPTSVVEGDDDDDDEYFCDDDHDDDHRSSRAQSMDVEKDEKVVEERKEGSCKRWLSFGCKWCRWTVYFFFPLTQLCPSICKFNPTVFWTLLPSILVAKAFWYSIMVLGLCDLAKIVTILPPNFYDDTDDDDSNRRGRIVDRNKDGAIEMTFGLWSYSTAPEDEYHHHHHFSSSTNSSSISTADEEQEDDSNNDQLVGDFEHEMNRVRTCEFHLSSSLSYSSSSSSSSDEGAPRVFFMDPTFRMARAFGVIAVIMGGLVMLALLTGLLQHSSSSSSSSSSATRRRRRFVGLGLWLCCAFEGLTLLIFRAGVCGSSSGGEGGVVVRRDCSLAEGSGTIFLAMLFWFLTGLSMMKLPPPPPPSATEELGEEVVDSKEVDGEKDDGRRRRRRRRNRRRKGGYDRAREEEHDESSSSPPPPPRRDIEQERRKGSLSLGGPRLKFLSNQTFDNAAMYTSELQLHIDCETGETENKNWNSWMEHELREMN